MKLKTILLSLSIISLYTPSAFSKKAREKEAVDKSSSTLYRLKIDNEVFELKENEQTTIQVAGRKHDVVLRLPFSKAFEKKGIYFQYPIHMQCTYDKKESEKNLKMWDIEGYSTTIMVQKHINGKGVPAFALVLLAKANFEKIGKSAKVKESVVRYHQKTIKGFKLEVINADNVKIVQEMYEFKISKDRYIIILQDIRDDFHMPSKEFIVMKKLFFKKLKIKTK